MSIVRTAYAFTPTAISNCALWLDGADPAGTGVVPASGTLATWVDKSRSGNNAIAYTGATAPSYSSTSSNVTFGTNYYYIAGISSAPSTQTLFMVLRRTTSSWNTPYGSSVGAGATWYMDNTNPTFIAWNPFGQNNSSGANLLFYNNVTNVVCGTNSSGTNIMYLNGTADTVGSTSFSSSGIMTIGTSSSGTNGAPTQTGFIGTISEVIFYSFVLGTTQRQQVEAYLAQKWGATSSLAAGHPGLTTRVYRSDYLVPNKVKPTPYYTFFSPRQIPGLVVWLDGADPAGNGVIPANGATVSTWTDKSGNGNNGTAVNTPTYALSSKGVATSSGAYFTLPNGAFPFNDSSYTYFFVFTTTTTGSVNSLFGGGVPGSTRSTVAVRLGTNGANNVIQTYWWANGINDLLVSNTYTANTISIAETWYATGSTRTITLNFAGSSTDSPAVPGARLQANTNNYLGLAYPGDGALTGFHYEFLVYNTSLSTSQRQLIESYLAQKWGLTASIPVGHSHLTQQAGAVTTVALSKFKVTGLPLASLQIPQTIAGLAMWLDATKITGFANGATLTSWTDSIGSRSFSNVNGVTYQTSIINGLPAVYMNGPGPYLEYSGSPPTLVSGGTIYGVVQNDADGLVQPNYSGLTFQVLWQINGYANGWEGYPYNFNNTTQLGTLATTRRAWAYPFSSTYFKSPHIVKVVSTTNSWIQSFIQTSSSTNSSYTDTSASTPTLISPMRLGACMDGPGLGYYKGYFAEILLYNRGLNSTEQTTIENYLKAKWNV